MKGGLAAAALAAMASGANAVAHRHAHAHQLFAKHAAAPGNGTTNGTEVCVPGCTTIWTTIYGEPTLVPETKTKTKSSSAVFTPQPPKSTSTPAPPPPPPATSTVVIPVVPVPTPDHHTCPTPGVYTFPATTITVSETTTVCAQQTTKVVPGTHTVGGVTTIVETATTVTCPYAKETTSNGVVTNVIETTVYVCPSAGTYTIAPVTKTVTEETIIVYPVPTTYVPGTYCAPEQVVTVTETDYVYVCPYTQQGLPTSTPVVEAPPAKETPVQAPPPKETVVEAPPPKETVVEVPSTTEAEVMYTPSAKKPSGGSNLQGSNDHYGITYTPYESSNGNCKSADAVDADIKSLKDSGFSVIRVYSTDCNTLETVAPACRKHGVQMIIGVFVKASGCSYETPDIKEQVDALAEWAEWDMVELFVVGNEAIMNGFCSATQLRELLVTVKEKCSGYTGRWTIAETLNIWERPEVSAAICDVVDVTGANIHPYFNSAVSPDKAGDFVSGQLSLLGDICPGNIVINLECGWPTRGNCNGAACPGEQEQQTAIQSIRESCGDKTVFFSYENDMWKDAGACGCEQSWGSKTCFA